MSGRRKGNRVQYSVKQNATVAVDDRTGIRCRRPGGGDVMFSGAVLGSLVER